jgi:hypothetical protein
MAHEDIAWKNHKNQVLSQNKQSNGFVLVTSFTSSQPLHGWTEEHALRELWQNFRDGLVQTFGKIRFSKESRDKMYYIATTLDGKHVGSVDCTNENVLSIVQQNCILSIDHLQLASSKISSKDIGGHGEGFKLGVNILLRKGFKVKYLMPQQDWAFDLRHSYSKNLKNMCVEFVDSVDRDEMIVLISGPNAGKLFNPDIDLDLVEDKKVLCENEFGAAYESSNAGWIYCKGLYVGFDKELRKLGLLLNLNTQPSRDRHMIPSVLWKQFGDILNFAISEEDEKSSGVFEHLISVCKKIPYGNYSFIPHIKSPMKKYVARQHNISNEEDVYFVSSISADSIDLAIRLKKIVVEGMNAYSEKVDFLTLSIEFMRKTHRENILDPIQLESYKVIKKLKECLILNTGFKFTIAIKKLPEVEHILPYFESHDVLVIDISSLKNSEDELNYLGTKISMKINDKTSGACFQVIAKIISDFKNPLTFVSKVYEIKQKEVFNDNKTSKSNDEKIQNAGKRKITEDSSSSNIFPEHPEKYINQENLSSKFKDQLEACSFKGVSDNSFNFPGSKNVEEVEKPSQSCESIYQGNLVLHVLDEHSDSFIYIDSLMEDDHQVLSCKEIIIQIHKIAQQYIDWLLVQIASALEIPLNSLPVVLVIVKPHILGFTDQTKGIFVNILPLVAYFNDFQKLKESIYLTILHEITHRLSKAHDTFFADNLALLVHRCRGIPF